MPLLLSLLPEDLWTVLLSEWVDPENDLRTVAEHVLGPEDFRRLANNVHVTATKVLSETCVAWLASHSVQVALLCTEEWGPNGEGREWRCNGKLHRDGDLPAHIDIDATYWYRHGQLHRDGDRPAVVCDFGTREWYQHGQRHRGDGLPAVVWWNGCREWWVHGEKVREESGPPVYYADGCRPFGPNPWA